VTSPRGYFRGGLHRRLFLWFGISILLTGIAVALLTWLLAGMGEAGWHKELDGVARFTSERFERVWDSSGERDELAASLSRNMNLDLVLTDPNGGTLAAFGRSCRTSPLVVSVQRGGALLGTVRLCSERHRGRWPWRVWIAMLATGTVLWAVSGKIAHNLTRPLWEISRVAQDIGAGRLNSRALVRARDPKEVRLLADSINDMASRIERQRQDQRMLLAAVSHELRTPLARVRVLIELLRESGPSEKTLDELEREAIEMDRLVGELLASSRLDFAALRPLTLDGVELSTRALERAGISPGVLKVETSNARFEGDATLIARALSNLIDNAERHGQGLLTFRVSGRPGFVVFEAEDGGPGMEASAPDRGSLGLGLTLVRRIAEAHGGSAFASSRPEGGARVGFEVATRGSSSAI
jgi:signal transduction histidine kinase